MTYDIRVHREAEREFLDLPPETYHRVAAAVDHLAENPRPRGVLKLSGQHDIWRLRVGAYRVIYRIDDAARAVLVLKVARRTERTYKGF